jgi:hypothetical protein
LALAHATPNHRPQAAPRQIANAAKNWSTPSARRNQPHVILQTLWIPAYPILALTILPLDIIAIYGLLAYGGRRRSVREAQMRAEGRFAS